MHSQWLLGNSTRFIHWAGHSGYGISLWPFGSAVLAVLHHSFWCTCWLAENGKLRNPWFRVSTAEQLLKTSAVLSVLFLHWIQHTATVPAIRHKIIPTEMRTTALGRWNVLPQQLCAAHVRPGYHRPTQLTAGPHITSMPWKTKPLEQKLKLSYHVEFLRSMNAV